MLLTKDKCHIIAEIGSNHNGQLETAYELIDIAAEAGADIAKFQGFLVDELLAADDPNYDKLKKLEVPRDWYPKLIKYCKKRGIEFLSTATNFTTLNWMEEESVAMYKVASCNISYHQMFERLIQINKPLIISTGLTSLDELLQLEKFFKKNEFTKYAFLHCVSQYPTPASKSKLRNISVMRELFTCPIGLSDHSHGTHIAVAAVALGAKIIEKHISLDRKGIGMDHEVAILPDEFKRMCKEIREVEASLYVDFSGDENTKYRYRRSLRFSKELRKGSIIKSTDLKVTRPENGILPSRESEMVGMRLTSDVSLDQPVTLDLIKV